MSLFCPVFSLAELTQLDSCGPRAAARVPPLAAAVLVVVAAVMVAVVKVVVVCLLVWLGQLFAG